MAKLNVTIPAVDVVVDGPSGAVTFRKVERDVREGDIVRITDDSVPSYVIEGAFYKVEYVDASGDPQIEDEDGDEYDLGSTDYEVYEAVTEPSAETPLKYREVKRHARAGERVRVFGHYHKEANGVFTVDSVDDEHDGYGEIIRYTVDGDSEYGTPYMSGEAYVVLEPIAPTPQVSYVEVKRKAAVGERIRIVERWSSRDPYENGAELTVDNRAGEDVLLVTVNGKSVRVNDREYVVLEAVGGKKARLSVGDYAKITDNVHGHSFEIGEIVEITVDDQSRLPYEGKPHDGRSVGGDWFAESECERATEAEFLAQRKPARLTVGDIAKVTCAQTPFMTPGITEGSLVEITEDDGSNRPFRANLIGGPAFGWFTAEQLALATAEEVSAAREEAAAIEKEAQEVAKWAKIGRKVGEYKTGDIVSIVKTSGEKGVGTVEYAFGPGRAIGVRMGAKVWDGSAFHGVYFDAGDIAVLITPVEQRFDSAAA